MSLLWLILDDLRERRHISKGTCPTRLQVLTEHAGILSDHALLDIAVFQDVHDIVHDEAHHALMLPAVTGIVPQFLFGVLLSAGAQRGRLRVPEPGVQPRQMGLTGDEIGVEHVAQLVSEQAAQLRIAFCAGLMLCDAGVPCVEPNQLIVGHGRVPVLRFPYRAYLHAPVVSVAAGLRQRHIGEVGGEGPR